MGLDNYRRHFSGRSGYGGYSQGKQHIKTCVFRRLQKTDSDDAIVTCCGRRSGETVQCSVMLLYVMLCYCTMQTSQD